MIPKIGHRFSEKTMLDRGAGGRRTRPFRRSRARLCFNTVLPTVPGRLPMTFTVISNSLKDGDYMPKDFILSADFGFGCAGGNKSPHLKWSGAPAGTKSFAVTLYDPDAPTGSGFWHWLGVNIRGAVTGLGVGAGSRGGDLPAGPRPPRGRPPAPLSFLGLRREGRKARRESGQPGRGSRVQLAFQHAGQGGDHGTLQAVT